MSQRLRNAISLVSSLVVLVVLIVLTLRSLPGSDTLLPAILFGVLIAFTTTFGVPLAGGRGSLLPMTMMAAYLVMGPVPTAWAAFMGSLAHVWLRYRWAQQLDERLESGFSSAIGLAGANATMQTVSILFGGLVYQWAGGVTPLSDLHVADVPPLLALGLAYLGMNLLIAGLLIGLRGLLPLKHYLRSLPSLIHYEAWPMVFSPLMALVYLQLGLGLFALLAVAIMIMSLIVRNLNQARQRLERRVRELDSLQAVGQALSASLELNAILEAIYSQVASLMPARNCYVALYDPQIDEVSFPLAIEEGERVRWRSRRTANGLTEYVLRTRTPLLIQQDYEATLERLGIDRFGQSASCWLGVPILAGVEPLGVLAVQSYSQPYAYDTSHQEVLVTIAAQAAVAIQNARLYTRTDEALARRVQELDSILGTTQEGILLFDPDYRVVAANRALADYLGVAQLELTGQDLLTPRPEGEPPLVRLIGYTTEELQGDCRVLAQRETEFRKREILVSGPPERYVERTLTPVHDRQGEISGWLLVFHDVTEERELAVLREDLTNMLIHDLRSPLTVLTNSLELMRTDLAEGHTESLKEVLALAEQSCDRVLGLINDLLDISRLESGQVVVHPREVEMLALLDTVATRFTPLANPAQIMLEVSASPNLPSLSADPEIIERVMCNLVDNAIKFTPDGGEVRLWARVDREHPSENMLLGVSDSGPGIPQNVQARLFQKFQQASSSTGRRRGTGLGLPFCKLAVEAHGGEIWVESEVGKGSTFVIRLPLAQDMS